jgi:hypothetical protein
MIKFFICFYMAQSYAVKKHKTPVKIREISNPYYLLSVVAAWRRRGFHCRSDWSITCKFAQTFGRATAPLAPNPS